LTARQAALQDGEQQLHAEKARLVALETALKVSSANQHLSSPASATLCLLCGFRIAVMLLRVPSCTNVLSAAASCFLVVISLHDPAITACLS